MFPEWVSFSSNTVYICPKQTPVCRYTDSRTDVFLWFHQKQSYKVWSLHVVMKKHLSVCLLRLSTIYIYTDMVHVFYLSTSDNQ